MTEVPLSVGDVVEVYQKKELGKRGKWSDPRPILSINHGARSLNIPGRRRREVTIAFEDGHLALQQQSFAHMVQEGIDALDGLPIKELGTISDANPPNAAESSAAADADFSSHSDQAEPCIGDKISVLWPLDKEYYPATVAVTVVTVTVESQENDGRITVHYDDRDIECLDITKEL